MPIKETKKETDIICNKCGIRFGCDHYEVNCENKNNSHYGLAEIEINGDQKGLCDSVCYSFSICDECLEEIFKTFKFQPETKYY